MLSKFLNSPGMAFGNKRHRCFCEIAYVLLLPVVVWLGYRFSPFNNYDGLLDAWVYFGYVHNFSDLIARYGLLYYAVRFGLIFPLIALVKVVGPISGYLVFVYLMYLLSGIPLYLLFRKLFSVHAAILVYAILVSSVWFARTVLWTHPDASAVPYLVAASALMFLEPKPRRLGNFAVGVLLGLAASSNVFALLIGAQVGIAYCVYYKNALWANLRQDIPWLIAGFFAVIMAVMAAYHICCPESNLFSHTLSMIIWSANGSAHKYQAPITTLLKLHSLYLLPFLMLSMIPLLKKVECRIRSLYVAVLSYLWATVILFVFLRFAVQAALLEHFYYFSFLLAPSILCMALIPVTMAQASTSASKSMNLALAGFLLPPLLVTYRSPTLLDDFPVYGVYLTFALGLVLILLAMRFKKVSAYAIVWFVISIQVALLPTVSMSGTFLGLPVYARMYGVADKTGLSTYRLGLKFIASMPRFSEERRPIYFWYSNADRLANSLQSTYLWGYSRLMGLNAETPGLPFLVGVNVGLLRKRSSLVLFDRDSRIVDEGLAQLSKLGVLFSVKRTREICEKEICYTIAVVDISADDQNVDQKFERNWKVERLLSVRLDWGPPEEGATIARESVVTSTTITTPAKAWNYGAVASMRFSDLPARESGVVRILVSVTDANAGLGFTGNDHSDFIKRVEIQPMDEPQQIDLEFDDLRKLHKFVVQTWDHDRSAKVRILQFSVGSTHH